jgi:hypothetical protein
MIVTKTVHFLSSFLFSSTLILLLSNLVSGDLDSFEDSYFVECPPIGLLSYVFLMNSLQLMGLGRKTSEVGGSVPSHHLKGTCHLYNLSLMTVTLIRLR